VSTVYPLNRLGIVVFVSSFLFYRLSIAFRLFLSHKVVAFIPMDLDGYLFGEAFTSGKKRQIQSRLAADFKGWEHDNALFEREIERVIEVVRTDESCEDPLPATGERK
jgi:hypothetical protein